MRVEFVSPYEHTTRTGIGRYLHTLVRHLSESVDVAIQRPRFLPLAERVSPLRTLPIGIQDHVPGSIVHFPQIMGCSQMLWRPVRPAVATVHDLGVLVCREEARATNLLDRFLLHLQLAGLKRMDLIFTRSHYTMKTVCDLLKVDSDRVRVTHGGIDTSQFQPVPQAAARLAELYGVEPAEDTVSILYVGNELPRKNLSALLQSMALLRDLGVRARLIKVGGAGGSANRKAFLAEAESLGLVSDVLLMGWVPDSDLPLVYSAADLFVLPSLVEGLGLPVLEAMACGTPVVCSNAGSLPEVVGGAGLLVEPHDVRGFAEAIAAVYRDRALRHRLIEEGQRRCRAFSWDTTVQETLAAYQEVLS